MSKFLAFETSTFVFIDWPYLRTLEHLVLGLLSNLPKGLLGLNDPLLPKSSMSVSSVAVEASETSILSIASFVKVSFESPPGLGQERLEGFLDGFAFKIPFDIGLLLWCYCLSFSTICFGYLWSSITYMDYEKTQTVRVS